MYRLGSLALRGSIRTAQPRFAGALTRAYAEDAKAETKIQLNFSSPYEVIAKGEYDWVTLPSSSGLMSVYPQHVPMISELAPGTVQVASGDKIEKFFISAGMAFIHRGSAVDVSVLEAVALDDLDQSSVQTGLDQANQRANSAKDETEKVEAQILAETYQAALNALGQK